MKRRSYYSPALLKAELLVFFVVVVVVSFCLKKLPGTYLRRRRHCVHKATIKCSLHTQNKCSHITKSSCSWRQKVGDPKWGGMAVDRELYFYPGAEELSEDDLDLPRRVEEVVKGGLKRSKSKKYKKAVFCEQTRNLQDNYDYWMRVQRREEEQKNKIELKKKRLNKINLFVPLPVLPLTQVGRGIFCWAFQGCDRERFSSNGEEFLLLPIFSEPTLNGFFEKKGIKPHESCFSTD
ncbi:hypothetical protein AVEN_37338-1 [Araneus ventricosus]|uniref:Uncharacterized protein n=1 Tax=Araneus ventricosus TaxID=182803 RepID=A0A4Y2PC66_ARAVE|nr:hypothetical protein AVEN_37338-1 [Araneus ventricosus]